MTSPVRRLLTRVTDAESEALSLTDVKAHLRITVASENDVLLLLITAVRQAVEDYCGRTLITSTWRLDLDSFDDGEMRLDMGPVKSIQSITYYDSDNAQQTLNAANYEFTEDGRLRPTSGNVWPSTYDRLAAVSVNYTAGETHLGKLPENLRLALRMMVGHYDINREGSSDTFAPIREIPDGFKALLAPFRVHHV